VDTTATTSPAARWELYRLLGEPLRLRLLALTAEDELAVGELTELVGESQPNVSKHVAALRRAGLLAMRKQGNRVLVRLADVSGDAVVRDALAAGRALVTEDGSLARVPELVRARDAASRAFFDTTEAELEPDSLPPELPAYLSALAPLLPHRELAVDVGTGDGRLLDVLAPVFDHVIAIDRSARQLARAKKRVLARGYANVELFEGELDDAAVMRRVKKQALENGDGSTTPPSRPRRSRSSASSRARAARSSSSTTSRTRTRPCATSKRTCGSASIRPSSVRWRARRASRVPRSARCPPSCTAALAPPMRTSHGRC
jgi:ArsR family transcriptional regulator